MIVSWYVDRGMTDDEGLFCTSCHCCFNVHFQDFYSDINDYIDGKAPDLSLFCPRCGLSCAYPNEDICVGYANYKKYKKYIDGV